MSIRSDYEKRVKVLHERHKNRHSGEKFEAPSYIPFLIRGALKNMAIGVFNWRITWFWMAIAVAVIVLWKLDETTYAVLAGIPFVLVNGGATFHEPLRKACMFLPDNERRKKKIAIERQTIDAREFITFTKLVSQEDAETIKSTLVDDVKNDRSVLHWRDEILGMDATDIAPKLIHHKARQHAKRAEVVYDAEDGFDITFFRSDPLDEIKQITEPQPVDLKTMTVPIASDSWGNTKTLSLKEKPCSLFGGTSGSGKTGSLTGLILNFAVHREDVVVDVIDNKGGDDWTAIQPITRNFLSVDGYETKFDEVLEYAQKLLAEMNHRIKTNLSNFGVSSWWKATPEQRREKNAPFIFVVIDECQELFDTKGRTEKPVLEQIQAILTSISKRGRSAGIHLMYVTQKATGEALSTSIKDQSNPRVSFRVESSYAEVSILGEGGDLVSPTTIPDERLGGAVFSENGRRVMGRFFYFDEKDQRKYIEQIAATGPMARNRDVVDIPLDEEIADGDFQWEEVGA